MYITKLFAELTLSGACSCLLSVLFCFTVGAVYLKNCIGKYWKEYEAGDVVGTNEHPYCIPVQAKSLIRDNIIAGIIQSPPLIW